MIFCHGVYAQNEIGPEGDKLMWILLILILFVAVFILLTRISGKNKKVQTPFFPGKKVKIELTKDRFYYPDMLDMKIRNAGNKDIDLDRPLLVFDNFWLKRKFRIKGMGERSFYPLYLGKGESHYLQIDLNRFYSHDKNLKKYPKVNITAFQ